MPTDISNSVGTARQFTPQPDVTYQGRYLGVSPTQSSRSINDPTADLAQNLLRLDAALQSHRVSHEKWQDAIGHEMAERMINGMSDADIERLNTIDAAQQEGYVDDTANPYFTAYAEKLRGGFLATKMKRDYDLKYSMSPAKSLDEEAQRYNEFSQQWKEDNLSGSSAPSNFIAFDKGYNENQLVNMNSLATNWSNTKRKEDVSIAMAQMNNELGSIVQNSPKLLETNGLMTQSVQKVLNETRLMGLPIEYRMKLMNDFFTQLVQTGHLTDDRLQQMADQLTVQTSIDGSTATVSSLMNMQTFKTAAATYNRNFKTQNLYDVCDGFIKKGEAGKKEFNTYVENMRKTDPDNALAWEAMRSYVYGKIDQNTAKQEAAIAQNLKGKLGGSSSTSGKVTLTEDADINAVIDGWMNDKTLIGGHSISSYKFAPEQIVPKIINNERYYLANGNTAWAIKLMTLPQAQEVKKDITNSMNALFASIKPTDDGGTNADGNEELKNVFKYSLTDMSGIKNAFGGEFAKNLQILNHLVTSAGDFDAGLRNFAFYNTLEDDQKTKLRTQCEDNFLNNLNMNWDSNVGHGHAFTGVMNLGAPGSGDAGVHEDYVDIGSYDNPEMRTVVTDMYTAYSAAGEPPAMAWASVESDIKHNYYTYHWGLFPKDLAANLGTGNSKTDDEYFFSHALTHYIYDTGSSDPTQIHIRYDPQSEYFTFFDMGSGGGQTLSVPLTEMRQTAMDLWNKDLNWKQENPTASTSSEPAMTLSEANTAREVAQEMGEAQTRNGDVGVAVWNWILGK